MKTDEIKRVLTQARPGDRLCLTFRGIDYRLDMGDHDVWGSLDYFVSEVRCGTFRISENQLCMLTTAKDRRWFRGVMQRRVEVEVRKDFDTEWFGLIVARNLERAEVLGPRPKELKEFDRRTELPPALMGSWAAAAVIAVWLLSLLSA